MPSSRNFIGADAMSGRHAISCTECQRRKKKCSRSWPCNHCRSRQVAHLCRFDPKNRKATTERAADPLPVPNYLSHDLALDGKPATTLKASTVDLTDGFRAFGYMPDNPYVQNATDSAGKPDKALRNRNLVNSDDIKSAMNDFPARSITDLLVQNYLSTVNYHYYPIYPPIFLDQYRKWWLDRSNGHIPAADVTCLLLRVFSCSVQFLSKTIQQNLEFELGENAQSLGQRYHRAAERLSHSFTPGSAGLAQVQQLFLTAYWFKSEAMFVESWHSLAAAIREAQELGMHKDSLTEDQSGIEREIRRRVWCILYAWDWQISRWLSRPLIINHTTGAFIIPTRELENSPEFPELPSPFRHMALTAQLSRNICTRIGEVESCHTAEQVLAVQEEVDKWIAAFPPTYSFAKPDTAWDQDHPYIVSQRLQLHTTALMCKLDPLKPYITRKVAGPTSEIDRVFHTMGIDCCLRLIEASERLFDSVFSVCPRFHLLICCIFDSAALLCSALLHDPTASLCQRGDILKALKVSLEMLEKLKPLTETGSMSYTIIASLLATVNLSAADRKLVSSDASSKIPGHHNKSSSHILSDVDSSEHELSSFDGSTVNDQIIFEPTTGIEDWQFWRDPNFQPASLSDLDQMDFGKLDQIWNWNELNLDIQRYDI